MNARLGRCFRSLALTQVILEPSDLNSPSYASMFYVSSSFSLAAPWPVGLLDRPIRYRNDRSTARPKRSTRRKRSRRTGLPLTRIALTAALPMTDMAIGGRAAGRRFRGSNTFGKDSA
jgi:hypothetical protein